MKEVEELRKSLHQAMDANRAARRAQERFTLAAFIFCLVALVYVIVALIR
jgi:hypothetical protein